MARLSNTPAAAVASDTVVSLASVLTPRAGDTIAEQFGHLGNYVIGKGGDRYPNLLAPITVRVGEPVDEYCAAVVNSQYTARARNAAKDEADIEAAFRKACEWRPSQTQWTALDELADRFVRQLMLDHARAKLEKPDWEPSKTAESGFYGTREDRAGNRTALLTKTARARQFGDPFATFVSDECSMDNGPADAAPKSTGKPGRKSADKLDLSGDDDDEDEAA